MDTEIRFFNLYRSSPCNDEFFSREFKLEAVKLVTERGIAVVQAARDLDVAESVLRRWTREVTAGSHGTPFLAKVRCKPEQQEIDRQLRREVAKLKRGA